jgi:hypothetical protein
MYIDPPEHRPTWQEVGFGEMPRVEAAGESTLVWRVTGTSPAKRARRAEDRFSNCFFVPAPGTGMNPMAMTASELQQNLNAALWGNTFRLLHVYRILKGTSFWIGKILHEGAVQSEELEVHPANMDPIALPADVDRPADRPLRTGAVAQPDRARDRRELLP